MTQSSRNTGLFIQIALVLVQVVVLVLLITLFRSEPGTQPTENVEAVVQREVRLALDSYRQAMQEETEALLERARMDQQMASTIAADVNAALAEEQMTEALQAEITRMREELLEASRNDGGSTTNDQASRKVLDSLDRLSRELDSAPNKRVIQTLISIERMVMETKLGVDNLRREMRRDAPQQRQTGIIEESLPQPGRARPVTATPSPTPAPTSTPEPTATAAPSSERPTRTPKPSDTPDPTFTPTPTLTPIPTETPMPDHLVPRAGFRRPKATPTSEPDEGE